MRLIDIVCASREDFFFFVRKCNEIYRSGHELSFYRKIIELHRENDNLEKLIADDSFIKLVHHTLSEWNMNQRGARLVSYNNFQRDVRLFNNSLSELYKFKLYDDIESMLNAICKILENIFLNIRIMDSRRRIIGVSKTLHFLLPDLIMPIDSKYTMPAFFGYNKYSSDPKKEFQIFKEIFIETYEIVEKLQLKQFDADGKQWNTSVPKLIDNAIIGFSKLIERGESGRK